MIVICESIILRKLKSLTMLLWLKKERKKEILESSRCISMDNTLYGIM